MNIHEIPILVTIILYVSSKSLFSQSIQGYVQKRELRNILDSADLTRVVVVNNFNENIYINNTVGNLKKINCMLLHLNSQI